MGNDPADKLEPPKLGFRRRKANKEPTPPPAEEPTRRLTGLSLVEERGADAEPAPALDRPESRRPLLTGHAAAAVTGLLVGLFLVLAVWGCERLSESTRNTSSLGRAGFPLLLGIFIVAVVGGALLLRACAVPSPGSVSFLGTGLVSVLAILFLTDDVDSLWGAAVVVALAVGSFVLARWVTVAYLDAE